MGPPRSVQPCSRRHHRNDGATAEMTAACQAVLARTGRDGFARLARPYQLRGFARAFAKTGSSTIGFD